MILSSGRTGLMYKDLVQDKKIALAAQAIGNFPGSRYPSLFTFVLIFALVIGPVNIYFLTRTRRRIWLLWTVPACSLIWPALVMV